MERNGDGQLRRIEVVDLSPGHEALYFACLEPGHASGLAEAGDHKARWYRRMRQHGLHVKLALDEDGRVGGMIQYLPIDHAPALGEGLEFILCIWVRGRAPGHASFQGHGLGTALLAAAEEDARKRGVQGMAAWGLSLPYWMRAAWFRRHGYRRADRRGTMTLVWKPFVEAARPPRWLPPGEKRPEVAPGKLVVTGCVNGWCPAQNLAFERARRAAAAAGDRVELRMEDTTDREAMLAWGECDALFIGERRVRLGPPPSQAKLARMIRRRLRAEVPEVPA